jgi:hypothetical protein
MRRLFDQEVTYLSYGLEKSTLLKPNQKHTYNSLLQLLSIQIQILRAMPAGKVTVYIKGPASDNIVGRAKE